MVHGRHSFEVRAATANASSKKFWKLNTTEKNIADILALTVEEGLEFFKDKNRCTIKSLPLFEAGLAMQLGQSNNTLSGGEAQRVKLASFLGKTPSTQTNISFHFDEPTTGLHFHDISKLLESHERLVDQGHFRN